MKKWLIFFCLALLAGLASIYIFIPGQLEISSARRAHCTQFVTADFMLKQSNWKKWWPEKDSAFSFNGYQFKVIKENLGKVDVMMSNGNDSILSDILIAAPKIDSTDIIWHCSISSGLNPFTRIKQYNKAVEIKKMISHLLESLDSFLDNKKNIYSIDIIETKFTDTFMISTETVSTIYPDNKFLYGIYDQLNNYAVSKGAQVIKFPMLNIEKTKEGTYIIKTALHINKEIEGNDKFIFRYMIQGNTLYARVIGGNNEIEEGIRQLRKYIEDYRRTSPAIPFQSLVTNRLQETDSSKWITDLYYPIL